MSIFYCNYCGELKDDDWDPPEDIGGDLVCGGCVENYLCDSCNEVIHESIMITGGDKFQYQYHAKCYNNLEKTK